MLDSTLQKRLVTGALLTALLLVVWYIGGVVLNLFLVLLSCLGLWEFYSMFRQEEKDKKFIYFGVGLGLLFCSLTFFTNATIEIAFLISSMILACAMLFAWKVDEHKTLSDCGLLLIGLVYIPFVLMLTTHLSPLEQLIVVFVPVVTDISAYFTGMKFGKHKIWKEVSPKKSVEGSLGGLCGAMVFYSIFGVIFSSSAPWWQFAFAGLFLSAVAQIGDFFESALKRSCQVKDSSNLLPGHGGILDRLDSVLFTIPVFMLLMSFVPTLRF